MMDVSQKAASWAKRTGLLAALVFSWACSDMGTEPMGPDVNAGDRQYLLGVTQEDPPAVVPGLTAEQLSFEGVNRTVTWSNCSSPTQGTFGYSVRGNAFGPYDGTFTETGTIKISPSNDDGLGNVTALKARFTIVGTNNADPTDRRNYTIKGTKQLSLIGVGECLSVGQIVDPSVVGELTYVAKIIAPTGHRFADRGISLLMLSEEGVPPTVMNTTFEEAFFSDLLAPTPCVDVEAGVTIGRIGVGVEVEECPPDLDF